LVDLHLLLIKLLSLAGCQIFRPDGGEIDLTGPGTTFVGIGAISDNEPPGLLISYSLVGVTSVFAGMA
jgi:hypothetical protein